MRKVELAVQKLIELGIIDGDRRVLDAAAKWMTPQGCVWWLQDRGWTFLEGEWINIDEENQYASL